MNVFAASSTVRTCAPRKVAAHLTFARARGRTVLASQKTPHPFHITRPFHYAGDPEGMATIYLQSSSGGLYGDDDLEMRLSVGEGAFAHVTTQASTIVHAARGGVTRQRVHLALDADSYLEYLPDPAILFAGANLNSEVTVEMREGARLMLCDSALTHDPDGVNTPFQRFSNTLRIQGADRSVVLLDRSVVSGNDWVARTRSLPVHGLLIIAGRIDAEAIADAIKDGLPDTQGATYGAVTALTERALCTFRLLAADGATFTKTMEAAWRTARLAMVGTSARTRRK